MKYSFCPSVRRLKTDYVEDVPVWKQWWLHVNWKWDIPAVINLWAVKFLIVLIYWKWMEDSFCPENDIVIFLAVAFFFSWSSLRINSKIILCKLTYVYLDKSGPNFLINLWRLFSACQHWGNSFCFFFFLFWLLQPLPEKLPLTDWPLSVQNWQVKLTMDLKWQQNSAKSWRFSHRGMGDL